MAEVKIVRRAVTVTLIIIVGIVLGVAILAGYRYYRDYYPVKVLTGSRYLCREPDCQKEYKNTVKEIEVPRKDAANYQIRIISSFPCPKCTVSVQDGERVTCPECGKVIKDTIKTHKVAKSQAKKYHVEKRQQVCAECKEEAEKLGSKDPIDREIVRQLRQKYYKYPKLNFGLVFLERDRYWWHDKNRIDARVSQLLVYHLGSHKIAIRLVVGYDDDEHALSRESYYEDPRDRNISAHYKGQAIDIFIADGVEIAWQASSNPVKRQKAQEKIRELIREIFDLSHQNDFLKPIQIIIYRQEDMEFFRQDIEALYGRTRAERGNRGLMWSDTMLDRIHIGY